VTSSSPGRGLDAVFADVLADFANRSLDLDPASRARLSALDGSEVQIVAELPAPLGDREFTIAVREGRLRFYSRAADHPRVLVRGSPPDLAAWLMAGGSAAGSRLVIEGDSTLLGELAAAWRAFRPDLGAPLSRLLGQEAAQAALGTAELAFAALRSALEGAERAVRDGAGRAFVDRAQTERFLDEIDDLQLRVDRLGARVHAQEQRRTLP